LQVLKTILNCFVLLMIFTGLSYADDLPISRRMMSLAPTFIETAVRVPATPVPGASGSVIVLFRTSEKGDVIDIHPTGGTAAMEQSAEAALKQWKFKTWMINGRPVQMISAVAFVFSNGTPKVEVPQPMSAQQLSPLLRFPCSNALLHHNTDSADLCKKQLEAVMKDKQSTPMERFTAYDEYGLALLDPAHQPDQAIQQFTQAISIAHDGLKESDPEWAYVYWHRATAEKQVGNLPMAEQDLKAARSSMSLAETASTGAARTYYHQMVEQITAQEGNSPSAVPTTQQP
jgi:hypothetical protein